MRVSGLRAWISPVGAVPGGHGRRGRARFLVANQNLLHLVLKCLMSTKHSGEAGAWQALFDAQAGGRKTTAKTADCGAVSGICKRVPPHIHRVVHRKPGRRTVALRCSFATSASRDLAPGPAPCRSVSWTPYGYRGFGSANSLNPAMATIVSPCFGATIASPVNRPKAGRRVRRRPRTKHGTRTDACPPAAMRAPG